MPVPGQKDDPGARTDPGISQRQGSPVQRRPTAAIDQPGQRAHELALTIAIDAREPDDLALPQLERYVRESRPVQGVDLEDDVACRVGGLRWKLRVHRASDDELDNLLLAQAGGVVGALALPVAQNRQPICDLPHFANSVRDIDHGAARCRDVANALEQTFHVFGQKVLGRLVQHENLGLRRHRLHDFDDEPLFRVQTEDAGARIDRNVVAPLLQKPPYPGGKVHQGRSFRLGHAEIQILGHGQIRHQGRFLADDGEPQEACSFGVAHRLDAVDDDAAFLRYERAGRDGHERRLAGAVLADEAMDLAGKNRERDFVERAHAREDLGHAVDL